MLKYLFAFVIVLTARSLAAQEEGFCRSGEAMIHYRVFGSGNPVVLINGGPGMNSEGFASLASKLSAHHRIIIFDQRGTGKSTLLKADSATVTMHKMAEDMEALRNHLHIGQWVVMGHSFGGMLASYYATVYPKNIRGMILSSSGGIDLGLLSGLDITARLDEGDRDSLRLWNDRIAKGDTSYHARWERGHFLAPAYLYDKKNIPVITERLTQGNTHINTLVWADMQKIHFNCAQGLQSFKAPVLIVQGKQDILDEKIGEKAHAVLHNSQFIQLDRCGHYGWLDRPDVYLDLVLKFLEKTDRS